ncbi:MAG: 50S ribosomal protein L22 [Candidatus Bathyarchaeia archaeon]
MPSWEYSVKGLDPDRTVKCSGRELSISVKAATEICKTIKGMRLQEAKTLLEEVASMKTAIPFRRYKKAVPHRRLRERWYAGRYPVKAAKAMLRLLEELEANAEYKGFNVENLRLIHAASHPGRKIRKAFPRAFGRASPDYNTLAHVELVGYETF